MLIQNQLVSFIKKYFCIICLKEFDNQLKLIFNFL